MSPRGLGAVRSSALRQVGRSPWGGCCLRLTQWYKMPVTCLSHTWQGAGREGGVQLCAARELWSPLSGHRMIMMSRPRGLERPLGSPDHLCSALQ